MRIWFRRFIAVRRPDFPLPPTVFAEGNRLFTEFKDALTENDIFPVEVKAEANKESRSLKRYKEKYADKLIGIALYRL